MIILRILLPLIYCLIIVGIYSYISNSHFIDSLAPAFFIQMLLMLFSGMLFSSLNIGIAFGLITFISSFIILAIVRKAKPHDLLSYYTNCRIELICFILIYLFIFISNYGKHFSEWDEFSHWGIFVKESFRLDALYCTSPASMVHKDYVPAITLFEVLWCKLSLRFSEADSYRAIQMLQMSMILPIAFRTHDNRKQTVRSAGIKTIIVLTIPLLFSALNFYHTIYQDLIFGILVYYCIYVAIITAREISIAKFFHMLIAVTVLVMSKMTAMAFLPFLVLFFFICNLLYRKNTLSQLIPACLIIFAAPVALWFCFNNYVDKYVPNTGNNQSYDSINPQSLLSILSHDGSISYQNIVDSAYLDALFSKKIIGILPYVGLISIIVVSLLIFMHFIKDKTIRSTIILSNIWILLASIGYAVLMYFLYLTAFSEYEATKLASFERYMSSYIISACYIAIFLLFYFSDSSSHNKIAFASLLVIENVIVFVGVNQILPGNITNEKMSYEGESEYINNTIPENGKLLIIARNNTPDLINGYCATVLNYNCSPRTIDNISPGTPQNEYDVWSSDISVEEFVSKASSYDYIFFMGIDDYFLEKYSVAFVNPEEITYYKIHQIILDGNKLVLE